MRLLFITNVFPSALSPTKGPFNLQLVRALSKKHTVSVVCPVAWTDEWHARFRRIERSAVVDGVAVRYPRFLFTPKVLRAEYGSFMWRSVRGVVLQELKEFAPDAVLGYWVHPDGEVAARAAEVAGVPCIVMVGGSDVLLLARGSTSRRRRITDVLRRADAVVPVGNDLKERLVALGADRSKVHVVPRGIDRAKFFPLPKVEARQRLNIKSDVPIVLWVGRMVPVKALSVLIDAVAIMNNAGVRFKTCLVGSGPLLAALQTQVRRLGVGSFVDFIGSVHHDALPDWYRAADVTVLPSLSEGIPNVLRESLACGTPFVASRVGGIPEIADSPACRLVPPGDAHALAAALQDVLEERSGQHEPVQSRQLSWVESAEALVRIIEPLVIAKRKERTSPA